jgi:DNA-binding transcriptional ArsR family regulator
MPEWCAFGPDGSCVKVSPVQHSEKRTDASVAKALSHPLRSRILAALENRTASPSGLAEELGVSLGVVSYHVRCLHAFGFLRLVERVPRRGAVEHYYTAVAGPRMSSQAWESTPVVVKHAVLGTALDEIGNQASAAAEAGGFEPAEAHLSRSPVTVDQEGWRRLADELDALTARIEQIASESRERLAGNGDDAARTATVAVMLFQPTAPGGSQNGVAEGAAGPSPESARPKRESAR